MQVFSSKPGAGTQAAERRWTQLWLAGRAVSTLASPAPPVPAGIFLRSRDSQGSGPVGSSLSATKPGSNPAAVLIYLTGPGSKWGWHKSCSAGPGRWAETSKHGAGGTSWVPSDARSQSPTAPAFPQTNVEPLGRDCFHCVLKPHCRPPSPALQRFSSFAPR